MLRVIDRLLYAVGNGDRVYDQDAATDAWEAYLASGRRQ